MTVKSFTVIVSVLLVVALLGGCGAQAPSESVTTTTVAKVNGTTSDVPLAGEPTADCVRTTSAGEIPSTVSPARPRNTKATSTSSSTVSTSLSTTPTGATTAAPTVHTLTPLASSSYYGLCELRKLPNGEVLAEVYQKIVDAVENCQATVEIGETLTESEMMTVFYHYYADYPQHFWCDSRIQYTISQQSKKIVRLKLSYIMTGETLQRARDDFHKAVLSFLEIAAIGNDEYERELLLHDALAKSIVYKDGGKHAHNAYGALVMGEAVCEGYARAFQYLLYQSGIQCLMAEGTSIKPSTGLSEGHAWNVVRIDGQYYHVDLTWDDTDNADTPVMYPYFNLTTAQINENHTIKIESSYALPDGVATAKNFHVKNGTRLTEYTVESVAQILNKTGNTHIYCVSGGQSFVDWFNNNHNAVLQAMGIYHNYSFNMLYTDNEVVVRLTVT